MRHAHTDYTAVLWWKTNFFPLINRCFYTTILPSVLGSLFFSFGTEVELLSKENNQVQAIDFPHSIISSSFLSPEFWGAYYYKNNDNFISANICLWPLLVHDSPRSKSIHSQSSRTTETGKPISVLMYEKVRMKLVLFLQEKAPALGFDIKPAIYLWVNKITPSLSISRQGQSNRHSWWVLLLVPKLS